MSNWKRFPTQLWLVNSLLAIALLAAVACGTAAPADPAPPLEPAPVQGEGAAPTPIPQAVGSPGEVKVHPGKITIMEPDWRSENFSYAHCSCPGFQRLINGMFIVGDERGELLPGMATDWAISADGLTWTFTVREGIKFHDGSEMTMDDVLWTWRHYYEPGAVAHISARLAQDVSRITERVELAGENQISITTSLPYAGLASDWSEPGPAAFSIMPEREVLWDQAQEEAYDRNPIGTGPMRLTNHIPATRMQFQRFDDYYYQPINGLPEDRRVKFTYLDLDLVPEESTRVAAIRAGNADIAPISLASRQQVEAGGARVVFGAEGAFFYVWQLGCWDTVLLPPCRDQRVRHALAYALDKELIRDRLYGPEVMEVKGWEPVTPTTIGYSPDLDPFPYDPDKARQLLAEAGYPGGAGFGTLVINTWVSPAPLVPESAQIAADMWRRELGLDVRINMGDRTQMTRLRQDGQFAGQIAWSTGSGLPDATRWVRSMYGTPERIDRLHNDPEIFDLVANAGAVYDPEQRQQAMNEMFQRLYDEHYAIALGYLNIPWAVGPRVEHWEPWPQADFVYPTHNIILK